ncbi:carbon monoxide dehydrogenase subunit G [Streptomyces sp. TLI_55]|uniref:SRPBCC domain-containing protein n=1 Tax=Streptomyces sp. TLI_55 TaxID=1938861 RepID=UPI000BDD54A6|nr:SRPBCC domain-containing protein [Streptomyces sp. TLI_55]SNX62784.1 carbon monoxide dehydrogenase subunit G [Streptomyces sp. TLI_55]
MEHEVFVPVPAERLREALADPLRVALAVPGLQQDAGAEPLTGRLKVRVGSHSVTYRGTARLSSRDDGTYTIEGDAAETRGSGTVKLTLTLRLTAAEGGTTLTFGGTAAADGRITELPGESVTSTVTRLLNRFAENLGSQEVTEVPQAAEETEPEAPSADQDQDQHLGEDEPEAEDHTTPRDLPAEAAHARRTMIGRSAEEVDHAPPRGRYAPVPAPQTIAPNSALRWAAPAAAVALASAIVVTRVLRKRR